MEASQFLFFPLETLPFIAVALIVAFTVHEFAHAYVAYRFGDPTAKNQGRLTLNPLVHLDPIGTLLILIAGFGWARPVPVNRFFFRRPRLAGILVAAAGPLSNLLIAVVAAFLFSILLKTGLYAAMSETLSAWTETLFHYLIYLNLLLFVFNLLPIPPLDGFRVLTDLSSGHFRVTLTQLEPYGPILFLFLVLTPLDNYLLDPLFKTVIPFMYHGIANLFF